MGTAKPRILPWLVSQLDLGQLEGVAWVNKSPRLRQDAQLGPKGSWHAYSPHHLSQQELGTFPSKTPLRTPMAEAVLLIPRKTFWMSYWVTWCWPHSQIRDPQAWL
uniref:Interferon regulatory factor 3 n=1 Tax=Nomascus leucogenys TaxID=61853 RepID=A0A2I3GZZ7_NOMLE